MDGVWIKGWAGLILGRCLSKYRLLFRGSSRRVASYRWTLCSRSRRDYLIYGRWARESWLEWFASNVLSLLFAVFKRCKVWSLWITCDLALIVRLLPNLRLCRSLRRSCQFRWNESISSRILWNYLWSPHCFTRFPACMSYQLLNKKEGLSFVG